MDDTAGFQTRRINKTKQRTTSKVDPSFKSKRYRDKLRTEVKALETLIPLDRPALNRKLDSQTVYRLVIAHLRVKALFKVINKQNERAVQVVQISDSHEKNKSTDEKTPGSVSSEQQQYMEETCFQQLNFQQSLDGIVIVLSIDGTIIFVSENIKQFLGFTQVDLIHRCFYGVVHPSDQAQVRDVLENNGEFSYPRTHLHGKRGERRNGDSIAVSIYCRLKCFNRNTSGYSKFHCTGKLQDAQGMLKSPKTSSRVALLYCRPFLFTEGESSQETNRGMFWSKHDLDLKISAAEDRITDVLGYEATDLCGTSLYQLVHPDDLCLLVQVHKTITDLNEIQSFYLRLQSKQQNWVWLHSKGKVICKNSKKFSIVFTHTPLKEVDTTFTDHETLLRRKYSSYSLMSLSKPPSVGKEAQGLSEIEAGGMTDSSSYGHFRHINTNDMKTQITLVDECPINNEIANILGQSERFLGVCPSTWHFNSERHSPMVPSSHSVHKVSYKDKQLQLMEKKHQQQEFFNPQTNILACTDGRTWNQINNHSVLERHIHRQGNVQMQNSEPSFKRYSFVQGHDPRVHSRDRFCYIGCNQSQPYSYPPSPPPSPRSLGQHCWNIRALPGHPVSNRMCGCSQTELTQCSPCNPPNSCLPCYYNGPNRKYKGHIQSHASIKVSMVYNSNINYYPISQNYAVGIPQSLEAPRYGYHGSIQQRKGTAQMTNQIHQITDIVPLTNQIKPDPGSSQSCAMIEDFTINPADCKQYDIEASIHMRIVESEENPVAEVNLPVSDSFMEYLNN